VSLDYHVDIEGHYTNGPIRSVMLPKFVW
jgi:hypothetical protein